MSNIAISVEGLGKAYHIGQKEEIPDSLVSAFGSWVKAPLRNFKRLGRLDTDKAAHKEDKEADDIFWALRDVSFEVKRGEVVGIIGRNGAGKSTLLKILSRITEPTTGRAIIRGRVSSLLEVGTGFHPELSGRENVYMNGTILGMTKREIDRKFDEIVDFSGVEKFLDTPVKRYSSGMKVRLAFAVAAHLEPEILIIDEVLAVGDAEFQKKCLGKMQNVASEGRTVLFVSHNLNAVSSLCQSVIMLNGGQISINAVTDKAISVYLSMNKEKHQVSLVDRHDRKGGDDARFTSLRILNTDGSIANEAICGRSIIIEANIQCFRKIKQPYCAFIILNGHGQRICRLFTEPSPDNPTSYNGDVTFRCKVPKLNLLPGEYSITAHIGETPRRLIDEVEFAALLNIAPDSQNHSWKNLGTRWDLFFLECEWDVQGVL